MDKANKIKLILLFLAIIIFFYAKNIDFSYYYGFLVSKTNNFDITAIPVIIIIFLVVFFIIRYNKTFVKKIEIVNGLIYAYRKDKTNFTISQPEVEKISVMRMNQNNRVFYVFTCKLMNNTVYRWKVEDKSERDEILKILKENNFIKKN